MLKIDFLKYYTKACTPSHPQPFPRVSPHARSNNVKPVNSVYMTCGVGFRKSMIVVLACVYRLCVICVHFGIWNTNQPNSAVVITMCMYVWMCLFVFGLRATIIHYIQSLHWTRKMLYVSHGWQLHHNSAAETADYNDQAK